MSDHATWRPGPRSDPSDPVQQAAAYVHERLEPLRAYHATHEQPAGDLPRGYSQEFLAQLCQAVDARDAEARQELAPGCDSRRPS